MRGKMIPQMSWRSRMRSSSAYLLILVAVISAIQNSTSGRIITWYQGAANVWSIETSLVTKTNQSLVEVKNEPSHVALRPHKPPHSEFLLPKTSSILQPATKDVRNCNLSPSQPLKKVESFPQYEDPSMYWMLPNLSNSIPSTNYSICRLSKVGASHFPHVMQQLYACYSYWQSVNDINLLQQQQQHKKPRPLLLVPNKIESKLISNEFLKGFLEVMVSQMGVIVSSDQEDIMKEYFKSNNNAINSNNKTQYFVQEFDVSGGYILSHSKTLNQMTCRYFHSGNETAINVTVSTQTEDARVQSCSSYNKSTTATIADRPRVGILNRRRSNGRSILNVHTLAETLKDYLGNAKRNVSIDVQYFEEKTFAEQVDFLHNTDILIAPHGAQLTGIPFLGNKPCSQLLELFPKGYELSSFFGSLARNSDVGYSYLYLSENRPEEERADSLQERIHARAQNVCPHPYQVVSAVKEIVADWEQCCHSLQDKNRWTILCTDWAQ